MTDRTLTDADVQAIRALTEKSYRGSDIKIVMKMLSNLPATARQLDAAREVGDMLDDLAAQAEAVPALLADRDALDAELNATQMQLGIAEERFKAAEAALTDALARAETAEQFLLGMIGLVQLIRGRDDVSAELRDVLNTNHRIVDARVYLKIEDTTNAE